MGLEPTTSCLWYKMKLKHFAASFLVGKTGLEPATTSSQMTHSTYWTTSRFTLQKYQRIVNIFLGWKENFEISTSWFTAKHSASELQSPYLNSSIYHYEQIPLPVTVNYLSISLSFLQYYYYMTIVCLLLIKSVLLCRLPCIVQSGDYNPPMRGLYGTRTHRSVWSSYALTDQRFPIHIDSPYINLGNINRLCTRNRLGLLRSRSQVMLQESLSTKVVLDSNQRSPGKIQGFSPLS